MKKMIIVIAVVLLVVLGIKYATGRDPMETADEKTNGDVVPSDPVEAIKYLYGENTKIYTCTVPVEFNQDDYITDINELPFKDTFIQYVVGVTEENAAVGQQVGVYGVDKKMKNNVTIENQLTAPSGALQVADYVEQQLSLLPEEEYDSENIVPYSSWKTCASQIAFDDPAPTLLGKEN